MIHVGIIGPGRAGVGLALALSRAGHAVHLHGRRGKHVPPPLSLTWGDLPPWVGAVEVVVLAVRDDAVADTAAALADGGSVRASHVVLHLSGILDETVLEPLRPTGAALGCWHPLQAITRPDVAPDRLRGAVAALTGDAPAVAMGERLARDLGMRPVVLEGAAKPLYHAAAAMASNYLVLLAALAERVMTGAGLDASAAHHGVATLMEGTLANIRADGAWALTGPIVRGDVETVRAHLAVLPPELREPYCALGRATLAIADLDDETANRMRAIL